MIKRPTLLFAALAAAILTITFTACEEKGPMEKAGEAADESVENAADTVKDATN